MELPERQKQDWLPLIWKGDIKVTKTVRNIEERDWHDRKKWHHRHDKQQQLY